MQLLLIQPAAKKVQDLGTWPTATPTALPRPSNGAFYWLSCERAEFEAHLPAIQELLLQLCDAALVDLHVSDLLNAHIPSTFDYTSDYDVMLFRRLASAPDTAAQPQATLNVLETVPVGYAVFDALLLSVHPPQCMVRAHSISRLLPVHAATGATPNAAAPAPAPGAPAAVHSPTPAAPLANTDKRSTSARLPPSSADLMLRQLNQMVDGYLNLRRDMAKQIDTWQALLLNPRSRFADWDQVLRARMGLHQPDEICEDQRAAVQDWIDALQSWLNEDSSKTERKALELLHVRSRDVLEHIERVIHHVHRLEQSAEAAVQMHFSAQSNRANDIMRTLTTLTAIFLPLNLIAAVFGMNFDVLPLVHKEGGFWWAMAAMGVISMVLLIFFWRRRYIEKDSLLGEDL